jgi:glycosyltransferase involved in cell wall biosynthesis
MVARDVLCFSHLRWNFVYQRPNHLMSRCARDRRVLFIEEPLHDSAVARLEQVEVLPNLTRVVPHLQTGLSREESTASIREMLRELCRERQVREPLLWFYTPLMLPLAADLENSLIVYDCMDELSNFLHAPPELIALEQQLLAKADVVFTGGMALYEAKRHKHPNVHGIPSSVDVDFFGRARAAQGEPEDQAAIAHPRVGYCGVIDERIDIELLAHLARERPDISVVMIGPVVKIAPESLPRLPNIHYLGGKPYADLPTYMAGWDAAIMPFALNDATRFISPTKTPEYLAAGKRVVSTAIADVIEPYERLGLVRIARDPSELIEHVDAALRDDGSSDAARDAFLGSNSWETTWSKMEQLMELARRARGERSKASPMNAPAQLDVAET